MYKVNSSADFMGAKIRKKWNQVNFLKVRVKQVDEQI